MRAVYQKWVTPCSLPAVRSSTRPLPGRPGRLRGNGLPRWAAISGALQVTSPIMEAHGGQRLPPIAIASYARPAIGRPDMLEIGDGGMTTDEYPCPLSLWSLLAAPLLAGNDLRSMDDVTKLDSLNTEVIAIDSRPGGTGKNRFRPTSSGSGESTQGQNLGGVGFSIVATGRQK